MQLDWSHPLIDENYKEPQALPIMNEVVSEFVEFRDDHIKEELDHILKICMRGGVRNIRELEQVSPNIQVTMDHCSDRIWITYKGMTYEYWRRDLYRMRP